MITSRWIQLNSELCVCVLSQLVCIRPLWSPFFNAISRVRLPPSCLAFAPQIALIYTSADHLQRGALGQKASVFTPTPDSHLTLCLLRVSLPTGTSFTSVLPGGKNECEICHQHTHSGTRLEAKLRQEAAWLGAHTRAAAGRPTSNPED